MGAARELRIRPVTGLPELRDGDVLGRLIAEAAKPAADEVVVVSQKAVSKVEGRVRRLSEVEPGEPAVLIGEQRGEQILCEEVARRLGTINYEVTCGLSPRVRRAYER